MLIIAMQVAIRGSVSAVLGGECPYGDKRLAQFALMRKLDVKRAVDSGKASPVVASVSHGRTQC